MFRPQRITIVLVGLLDKRSAIVVAAENAFSFDSLMPHDLVFAFSKRTIYQQG